MSPKHVSICYANITVLDKYPQIEKESVPGMSLVLDRGHLDLQVIYFDIQLAQIDHQSSWTHFKQQTGVHSSRMRTVRCSSRLPGGVSGQWGMSGPGVSACQGVYTFPPLVDRQTPVKTSPFHNYCCGRERWQILWKYSSVGLIWFWATWIWSRPPDIATYWPR